MSISTYNKTAVNRLAQTLKVLSEPNRLRILCSLGLECRPVTDIIEDTGLAQTNVSFHLRTLREAGLVKPERRGPYIYYCLPDPQLLNILSDLNAWLHAKETKGSKPLDTRSGVENAKVRKFCQLAGAAK